MLNYKETIQLIGRWGGTLKFFPSDPDARIGIAEEICKMASDIRQVRWLVGRIPQLFTEWPGSREVRAVFIDRYKPVDGVTVYSTTFPHGIPSEFPEPEPRLLEAPKQQAESTTASEDPEMAALVEKLANRHSLIVNILNVRHRDEDDYTALVRQMEKYRR